MTDAYQPNVQYLGEDLIKRCFAYLQDEMSAWVIWDNEKGLELCNVVKTGNAVAITKILALTNFFQLCGVGLYSIFQNDVQPWLNLCHYEDENGEIHYDSYYDRYPISDRVEVHRVSVGDLRNAVRSVVSEYLPFQEKDTVILANHLSQSNLMKDALQRAGCNILIVNSNEVIEGQTSISCAPPVYVNLFVVGSQSMITVPMEHGQEMAVYEVSTDQNAICEPPRQTLYTSYSDMLGNSWLSSTHADGNISSRLYNEGKVDYCELNSK